MSRKAKLKLKRKAGQTKPVVVSRRIGWNDLFVSGSIVDLTVSIWRASIGVHTKDLGIENSAEVARVLSLGRYRLAPQKSFEKIAEASRAATRHWNYYSLNFGLIPGARYVPDTNLPKLLEELRVEQGKFNEAVNEFLTQYEAMKNEMLPVIEKAIQDASRDADSAKVAFERVQHEYPTVDMVRLKFKLSWSIYAIQGAKSQAAAEMAENETDTIKDVVKGMVTQLRDDMGEKLAGVLNIVNKGGVLKENSIQAAIDVLDRVDSLNILGDEVLAEQSRTMRAVILGIESGKRVSDNEVSNLEDIQKELEQSVQEAVKSAEANLMGLGRRKLGV